MDDPTQIVHFGTSGHRGSPLTGSFTEAHIGGEAEQIVNFVTCHDGFTLSDLSS